MTRRAAGRWRGAWRSSRGLVEGRRAVWIAWSILTLSVVPVGVGFLFVAAGNHSLALSGETAAQSDLGEEVFARFAFVPFGIVGAVIVSRQSRNVIGWLCSAIGLGTSLFQSMEDYAFYALARDLPLGVALAVLGALPWSILLGLIAIFLPLLFPTGRLVSPRWRPIAWAAAVATAAASVFFVLRPIRIFEEPNFPANPLGINSAAATIELALSVALALIGLFAVLAAASVVVRFRRATGVERQQLKWFTYAAAQLAVFFAIDPVFDLQGRPADALFFLSFALVPAAIGIAVLRYRLYDIDRLINRTLVYGSLTALLGAVYAGTVLLLGQLFGGLGGEPPSWAVASATLAVAALFQPARRRIQTAVDRRFNRRRYDAAKTIEAFSARLRDQVDLDTLTAELLAVVDRTMEPTAVSLWLRPQAPPTGQPASRGRRWRMTG
jgi:hypothetical protein